MLRQIILDTETTGLDPEKGHRIIEVGCLEMLNRRITGSTFHRFINPQREVEREAEEVHGITSEFLLDKPLFREVVDELIAYIDGAQLIIHNAPFDVNFLDHEFHWAGKRYKKIEDYCSVFDTLTFARRKHPGQRNSLDALCSRYHVDNSNRELHGALLDAELLAQVYLLLTGGQGQLFQGGSDAQASAASSAQIKRITTDRKPLKVIHANKDEVALHDEFIGDLG
jgi:DNA polymerase-3 subunit epsilon